MFDYDYVIVGSGFGGSAAGLRLVEKGYRVLMLEKGLEFSAADLPKTNWNLRRWMWLPWLGLRGIFQLTVFRHMTVMSGVAVGGGSLTYGAALPIPPRAFFEAGNWHGLADWHGELAPHYTTARRMLGVTPAKFAGQFDQALAEVARRRGESDKFAPNEVGIYFGAPGKRVSDPFFDGAGPERSGCIGCGGCMLGCPFGAKNTLDRNYLYLARARGLALESETEVTAVRALDDGGYRVEARQGRGLRRRARSVTARNVVLAAGVLGTVRLLLRMKADPQGLPRLSEHVGRHVRTNSESFIGVVTRKRDADMSSGVAIGSIYHCGPNEHVQPVRYRSGSGFFRVLMFPHVPGLHAVERLARLLAIFVLHPLQILRAFTAWNMARRMAILMYMRTEEGTLRFQTAWHGGLTTRREEGSPPVASFPAATRLAKDMCDVIDGFPMAMIQETLFNIPTTAHVLGGAVMGRDIASGVIDSDQRVFGYDGLFVMDGSAVSSNPGVNPSLSITAMAERALARIPARADVAPGHAVAHSGPAEPVQPVQAAPIAG